MEGAESTDKMVGLNYVSLDQEDTLPTFNALAVHIKKQGRIEERHCCFLFMKGAESDGKIIPFSTHHCIYISSCDAALTVTYLVVKLQ